MDRVQTSTSRPSLDGEGQVALSDRGEGRFRLACAAFLFGVLSGNQHRPPLVGFASMRR
ncbi:MAG: hypothetical protein OEW12_07150 [Deltaproteobacteria bacterium]|nr:hypothetical protein [Deltaproteobacteria bacterium]